MWSVFIRFILDVCAVPAEPSPPSGSPGSLVVSRAAPGYFRYRIFLWVLGRVGALAATAAVVVAVEAALQIGAVSPVMKMLAGMAELAVGSLWLLSTVVGFALLRLDYEMRWYMVTDRSLRIREGILIVREMTLTFANVQNIGVAQGPLQQWFGIADLQVETAGGGGSQPGRESAGLHVAILRGVANAATLRESVLARMRKANDAGLGDPDHRALPASSTAPRSSSIDELAAARELLTETRALHRAVANLSAAQT